MAYSKRNPNGQATMANSEPVVVASDQSAVPVSGTVSVTGVSTLTEQQTQTTHLATIAGDTTNIETSVQLIDDTVTVLGTNTYTEAASKGLIIAAVRRDADTTLVDTTNEFSPLQVDANGRLKVEVFSGETLPISGTVTANLAAGTNNIGDVDVLTLPSIPAGNNNIGDVDIASIAAGDNNIGNVDIVTMPNVTNGGTFVVQENGSALTALQLIDDIVYTDDTSTHATGTSKGALMMAAATPTDTAVNANDIGALAMTVNRELLVQVNTALPAGTNNIGDVDVLTVPADPFGTNADAAVTAGATGSISAKLRSISRDIVSNIVLAAGTNAIGKLAANSGIDIGDVDVTSIIPGTGATNLGKAIDTGTGATDTGVLALATRDDDLATLTPVDGDNVQLRTDSEGALWVTSKPNPTEGASTMNATSSDGATALTSTAQAIKASAGCLYGYYIYNPNSSAAFVQFYNTASGSVTVGTTNPLFMLTIPASSAANLWIGEGVLFSTAMSWSATSTAGGNGAPTTALDAVAWYK